jgi:CubicO group peptidase (beta-lactamase class C family)
LIPDKEILMQQALDHECERASQAGLLHGAVLAAGRADTEPLLYAWGNASVEPERRGMTPDAIFDAASVTKAVATASACAVCIDEGRLDPDAPAATYLPTLGGFGNTPVLVRHLATHSSGFDNRKFDKLPPDEMLRAMVEHPAQRAPTERFEYSCRNYVILGLIVEQITGQDLGTFCQQRVFTPTGMTDTAFGPLDEHPDRVVPTYVPAGTISDEQARRACRPIGNAGMFTTALDLARFCRMNLNGGMANGTRVLGEKALAWLLQPCSPPGLAQRSFGWDMRDHQESPCRPTRVSAAAIGHSGWTGQSVWIDPERGCFTVVLTNRTHEPGLADNYDISKQFRSRIADLLIEDL